jgi:FMN phosphatase YigB (HAD superfamily)
VVSGAVNKRKPSEEIFKSTLKLMTICPEEAIFVGDTIDADMKVKSRYEGNYIERRVQKASEVQCGLNYKAPERNYPRFLSVSKSSLRRGALFHFEGYHAY